MSDGTDIYISGLVLEFPDSPVYAIENLVFDFLVSRLRLTPVHLATLDLFTQW